MFSLTNIPSTTTVLSAYTAIAASTMLIRTVLNEVQSMANQFIPKQIQGKIFSIFERLYGHLPSQVTLAIHEYDGYMLNEMFEAAELYLRTKISPSNDRLRVRKIPREKNLLVTVEKGQDIIDVFEGIQMNWKLNCTVVQSSSEVAEKYFELSFNKKFYNRVLNSYLANVLEVSKVIKEENRILKLYSPGFQGDEDGGYIWGAIKLNHPSTFDTLAMDSELKNQVLDDLDRFVKRREFYRRVGKAWKRGYLLYGPPGTGKSSLIAAMANYLNFNIYDLELANVKSNSELRRLLVATTNRSILVIEDVDCTVQLQDRSQTEGDSNEHSRLTLSGLLNFVDGLWSSCGDERIIVLTTNHKERLDPALLRPGRMDMQIHMSYCTPGGFKLLASNYLAINDHPLFKEVGILIKQANSTPAEIAEELMKSDDAETSLKGLINFLNRKMTECNGFNADHGKDKQDSKRQKSKDENKLERETRRTKRIKTRR